MQGDRGKILGERKKETLHVRSYPKQAWRSSADKVGVGLASLAGTAGVEAALQAKPAHDMLVTCFRRTRSSRRRSVQTSEFEVESLNLNFGFLYSAHAIQHLPQLLNALAFCHHLSGE